MEKGSRVLKTVFVFFASVAELPRITVCLSSTCRAQYAEVEGASCQVGKLRITGQVHFVPRGGMAWHGTVWRPSLSKKGVIAAKTGQGLRLHCINRHLHPF
jgi:hypothetical protein